MPKEIRVLVADAYPLSRAGIRALLAAEDDLTLVGEAADARGASRLSAELQPDVLLLDTNLAGLPAVDLVSLLHRDCPTVRVLALVASNEEDGLRRLLAAGAAGCVLRSEATERVVAAVGVVDPLGHTRSYGYDAQGRMTSFSDPQGHSVSNQFDGQGRVIVQRDKLNQPSYFAYSAERTVFTDTRGIPITHTYNTLGVLVSVTDALGHSTQYEHDHNYNVVAVTDPLSRTTRHTWSDCGCTIASVEDPLGHLTRMEYDGHNNLLSETDALTRTTRYAYDAQDNLIAITNTLGYTSTFSYDAYGQMVASTDANGHHSEYAHDPYGNLALITDTLGQATDMGYDLAGQLSSVTDANQHTTTFEYNAGGRLITTTDALSGQTIRDYDAVGRLTQVTDANGKPTSYQYDAAGRLITVTNALEGRTVYDHDAGGNLTRLTDARGKATLFGYDALNRTVAITDTLGHATWFGYDAVGNRTTDQDPTDVLIRYSYDDLNRPEEVSGPLGLLSSYGYDPLGNLTRVTDANGHVTRYTYDPLDRLETVLDALDGLTVYDYDPLGNLRTATDARQHSTTYDYDALNRLQAVTDPLSHVTAYGYDAVGNTTVITDADQLVTYLIYDALDRLAQVQYADAALSYAYDAVGNRLAMTDTTGTTGYVYDSLYRPLTITAPYGGPVGYRYDPAGNRIQTLYPAGELVTYGYDDANRLERVWDWASGVTTYTYDDAGRVLVALLANGVASDYDYDAAGRLLAIEHRRGEDWLTRFDYQLDLEGNRVALTETTTALTEYALPALGRPGGGGAGGWGSALPVGETIRYGYDTADRLRDASYANGDRYQYSYDAVGNRLAYSVTAQALLTGTTTYVYDDADRLTYVDATPVSYDNRGNQLTDGTWTYTYDAAGRMVRAETITSTQVYTYNGDGLLLAQNLGGVETAFTWDQALALPQVLATSIGLRGLYGLERLGVVVGSAWEYPQHDAIGSVRQWTDALGAVVGLQGYAPFGEPLVPLGPPPAPWGFTGEWQDPAGLVYLRARWYNPALGRFTQVDPLPAWPMSAGAQQAYLYALGNPLAHVDPTGLQPPVGGPPQSNPYAYRAYTQREEQLLAYMLYNEMHWIGVDADELNAEGLEELAELKKLGYREEWMRAGAWVAVNRAVAGNRRLTAVLFEKGQFAQGRPKIETPYEEELWRMALEWAHRVYWREYTGETDPTGGAWWFFHAHEKSRGKCADPRYIGKEEWRTKEDVFLTLFDWQVPLPAEWHPIPGYLRRPIPCWAPRLYYVLPEDLP